MMSSRLTVATLERAVADRQPQAGLVHHSNRGLQYASPEYVAALDKYGIVASMSRPANPYDKPSLPCSRIKPSEKKLRASLSQVFIESY
jgi:putative transposase